MSETDFHPIPQVHSKEETEIIVRRAEISRIADSIRMTAYNYGKAKGFNVLEAILTDPDQLKAAKRLLEDVLDKQGILVYEKINGYFLKYLKIKTK